MSLLHILYTALKVTVSHKLGSSLILTEKVNVMTNIQLYYINAAEVINYLLDIYQGGSLN